MEKIGKYEILEELESSSLIAVYKARDPQMERDVVLKVLTVGAVQEPVQLEQFKQETLAVARLHHPHLAPVYDFSQTDDKLYAAIRFVEGKTLRCFLNERKQLPLEEALPILEQLADILDHLKTRGFVYRVLDLEKVILEGDNERFRLVLTDLGLVAEEAIEQANVHTSPVYIVSSLAFEMLAGRPPIQGELTRLRIQPDQDKDATGELTPDLDEDIVTILLPGRLTTPIDRFENAGELVSAMQLIAESRLKENQNAANTTQLLNQAQEAMKAGDWLEVQDLTVQILKQDQTNGTALNMMAAATALLRASRDEEAKEREWYQDGKKALEAIGRFMNTVESVLEQSTKIDRPSMVDIALPEVTDEEFEGEEKALGGNLRDIVKMSRRSADWLAEQGTTQLSKLPTRKLDRIPERHNEASRVWGRDGKVMVHVASGGFPFGSENETTFLGSFWIDKTPVTNAEYKRFLDANTDYPVPYSKEPRNQPYNWDREKRIYPVGKANHPVVLVSWLDAQAYAKWAGKRLPTEQEWEKAARGPNGRAFPWGGWREGLANTNETKIGKTTPVGQYSPAGDSDYGCVDMSGNVWEWTAIDYHDTNAKVLRGGSWCNNQLESGCTIRSRKSLDSTSNYIGFRLVVSDND